MASVIETELTTSQAARSGFPARLQDTSALIGQDFLAAFDAAASAQNNAASAQNNKDAVPHADPANAISWLVAHVSEAETADAGPVDTVTGAAILIPVAANDSAAVEDVAAAADNEDQTIKADEEGTVTEQTDQALVAATLVQGEVTVKPAVTVRTDNDADLAVPELVAAVDGTASKNSQGNTAATATSAPTASDSATLPEAEATHFTSDSDTSSSGDERQTTDQKTSDPERSADTATGREIITTSAQPDEGQQLDKTADTNAAPAITQASGIVGASPTAAAQQPVADPASAKPQQPTMVAVPEEIVDIVSEKLSSDKGRDRVLVQLDPPELGRVSIDFKFDANGLQHVTITSDVPDALRRLRLLHFELSQALEQHGLSSQDMTFQQQQQNPQRSFSALPNRLSTTHTEFAVPLPDATVGRTPRRTRTERLDIKL